jgi:hypothetical protein
VVTPAGRRRGRGGVGGGDGGGVPVRGGGAHGLRGEGVRGGGAHGRRVVMLEGGRLLGLGLPSVGHRGGVGAALRRRGRRPVGDGRRGVAHVSTPAGRRDETRRQVRRGLEALLQTECRRDGVGLDSNSIRGAATATGSFTWWPLAPRGLAVRTPSSHAAAGRWSDSTISVQGDRSVLRWLQ